MQRSSRLQSCAVTAVLILCLIGTPTILAQETKDSANLSTLKGKISNADGSPLVGASIKLFHLSSEQLFEATTAANGSFAATNLPYGYFDIAIETADGFFVTNSVVNLPPSDTMSISLKLAAAGTLVPDRSFPGVNRAATGSAIISGNVTGTSFWASPKGIGTLAGGGAALLLLLAGGSSSSNVIASPSAR